MGSAKVNRELHRFDPRYLLGHSEEEELRLRRQGGRTVGGLSSILRPNRRDRRRPGD